MLATEDLLSAYRRAVAKVGEAKWPWLQTHDQTEFIYRELRALDMERIRKWPDATSGVGADTSQLSGKGSFAPISIE